MRMMDLAKIREMFCISKLAVQLAQRHFRLKVQIGEGGSYKW